MNEINFFFIQEWCIGNCKMSWTTELKQICLNRETKLLEIILVVWKNWIKVAQNWIKVTRNQANVVCKTEINSKNTQQRSECIGISNVSLLWPATPHLLHLWSWPINVMIEFCLHSFKYVLSFSSNRPSCLRRYHFRKFDIFLDGASIFKNSNRTYAFVISFSPRSLNVQQISQYVGFSANKENSFYGVSTRDLQQVVLPTRTCSFI